MKSIGRFIALTVSTAALVAVPVAGQAAAPADHAERAGAKKFVTIKKAWGAQQQACKVLTPNGKKYKIFTRVVNNGRTSIGVGLVVEQDGKEVDRFSTPLTPRGRTSKAGSVTYPLADEGLTLVAFQFQGQMGDAGPIKLKKIKDC